MMRAWPLVLASALDDGLVSTPPMGFNTWNGFGCELQQDDLLKSARIMRELGLQDLGYQYFVVDDCWMSREREKSLQADAKIFPSGMKVFGDALHEMHFLFGIYTCRGVSTCEGRPSSRDYEEVDADAFAQWGVDYVKNDACWDPDCGPEQSQYPGSGVCDVEGRKKAVLRYKKMQETLNHTGRPMVYSLAGWQPWFASVGGELAHLWRVGADVRDWHGVYEATRLMEQLREYHGHRGWNDPDMLLGSSPGATLKLTPLQSRAQFSLWSLLPAPLMLGVNLLQLSAYDALTYSNLEAIEINQDPLLSPAEIVFQNCPAYPRFILGRREDGAPTFELDLNGVQDPGVVCGAHTAADCRSCCQGHGEGWCHGDCEWHGAAGSEDCGQCVLSSKAKDKPKMELNPNLWQRKDLKEASQHQCQQVWVRRLSGGQVGLVALNFASKEATVELRLSQLRLPWGDQMPSLAWDLWRPAVEPWTLHETLHLVLEADGGHRMLKMEAKNTEVIVEKGFKEVSLRASLPGAGRREPPSADWSAAGGDHVGLWSVAVLLGAVLLCWAFRAPRPTHRLD